MDGDNDEEDNEAVLESARSLLAIGTDAKSLDMIEGKVDAMEVNMKEMDSSIKEMGGKVDAIEGNMKDMDGSIKAVEGDVKEMKDMMMQMMQMMQENSKSVE